MDKRFRLIYGESYDDVKIADDVTREYIFGLPVDLLNEYDAKINILLEKLEELGFKLIFIKKDYNMDSKEFEKSYTINPNIDDNGEWVVIPIDEFNKLLG